MMPEYNIVDSWEDENYVYSVFRYKPTVIKWSKVGNPSKWENPKRIYCFHWRIAKFIAKFLSRGK